MTGIYLTVHSDEKSSSPLHIRSLSEPQLQWDFPASYTGHRSVCKLPGATADMPLVAWVGGDEYTPGDPFGYTLAADERIRVPTAYSMSYGSGILKTRGSSMSHWAEGYPLSDDVLRQVESPQSIYLTRTSPVSVRLNLWSNASDRSARFGNTESEIQYAEGVSVVAPTTPLPQTVRVRVVRVAINGIAIGEIATPPTGVVPYRVVFDCEFSRDAIPFLSEADFLGADNYDIDWNHLHGDTAYLNNSNVRIETVTYLVVVGDGSIDLAPASGTTSTISAIGTITRRFDARCAKPVARELARSDVFGESYARPVNSFPYTGVVLDDYYKHFLRDSRPTFVWSMPSESAEAKRFGSSYTAFRILLEEITSRDPYTSVLVWASDVTRAPAQDSQGRFAWTAPFRVGDTIAYNGSTHVFKNSTEYNWYVTMYNSKFKPSANLEEDLWSDGCGFYVSANSVDRSAPGIYLTVHSSEKSSSPLHIRSLSEPQLQWDFPASYTGSHNRRYKLPGATSDMAFIAWASDDEEYSPGDLFGYTPAASANSPQSVCLTRVSPVCPRVDFFTVVSDRVATCIGPGVEEPEFKNYVSGGDHTSAVGTFGNATLTSGAHTNAGRVRVVRYAVDGFVCTSLPSASGGHLSTRVVFDRTIDTYAPRPHLSEIDFYDAIDVDWEYLAADLAGLRHSVGDFDGPVRSVSYLVVMGDNPVSLSDPTSFAEGTVVRAYGTFTRYFDEVCARPVAVGLAGGDVLRDSRPTFVWSSPDESVEAKRFGSSYVAFRIQMQCQDTDPKWIWTSDVTRAPEQDTQGRFVWTAPFRVGDTIVDDNGVERVFANSGSYKWRVAMYNSKFKPAVDPADDEWSNVASFSTAVDA